MEIIFEAASMFGAVIGNKQNKGETVRHPYPIDFDSAIFGQIGSDKTLETIPPEISKKFQSIEIVDYKVITEKKIAYHHFSFLFIFREKQNYRVTKLKEKPRLIRIGADEFPCIELFATIIPHASSIILDRRANLTPVAYFFRSKLKEILTPRAYGLAGKKELFDQTRISIHQNLEKNYKEILKANFSKMKKLSVTLAKPLSVQKIKSITADKDKQGLAVAKGLVSSILGQSIAEKKFLDLPIKTMQVSITLDDTAGFKNLKKNTKDKLLDIIENELVTSSFVEFESDDPDKEIERAVLSGIRVTEKMEITPASKTEDKTFMWKKQREVYTSQVE